MKSLLTLFAAFLCLFDDGYVVYGQGLTEGAVECGDGDVEVGLGLELAAFCRK